MNKQSNFLKIPLLISAMFFVVSLITFVFLYKAVNTNNKEALEREEKWRNEELRREGIKTLDSSVKAIEEEIRELETHFAKSSNVVPFLNTIEGLASRVGAQAEVTFITPLTDQAELTVEMKTSGTFDSLYKFLTLLENSPYELEFVGVNMSKEAGSETEGKNVAVSKWSAIFKIKLLSFVK